MLNEVKLKSIPMGQLIITDRTAEVCRYIKIASEFKLKKDWIIFLKHYFMNYLFIKLRGSYNSIIYL